MSPSFPFGALATLRDAARTLAQRAGDHEEDLQALVAAAEVHVALAEQALSDALQGAHRSVEHLRGLLSALLRRSRDGADAARRTCVGAHEQRVATDVLLTHLEGQVSREEMIEARSRRRAVLVVDDYGEIREVVAEVLRTAGFVVRTAVNGLEALLAAQRKGDSRSDRRPGRRQHVGGGAGLSSLTRGARIGSLATYAECRADR